MTELIDDFQTKRMRGRGMALTLLILTTIGSLLKLGATSLIVYFIATEESIKFMDAKEKFAFLVVLITGGCAILNFVGSLAMFRRKSFGIWLYTFSQIITVSAIFWATFATNKKLYTDVQIFLLIVFTVPLIFTILYWANRKYWNK